MDVLQASNRRSRASHRRLNERRIYDCTSVESTVARASSRRLDERRIDGYKRRIYDCTSVESTIVQASNRRLRASIRRLQASNRRLRASNRRLNERRIKQFRYTGCPFSATVVLKSIPATISGMNLVLS